MANAASRASATGSGRSVPLEMPRLSSDEGTATLSAWLVAVGDRIEKGGLIAELETDKATVELEAPVEGRIESLLVAAGTEGLKPGTLLGRIVAAASVVVVAPLASVPPAADAVAAPPPLAAAPEQSPESPVARSVVTPLARRLAEAQGIDLERVTGTGVGGRIVQADIERSLSEPLQAAPVRAAAAKPVAAPGAASDAPRPSAHLHLHCAMEAIVAARIRLNEDLASRGQTARITLNDFIVRAAALALRDVPAANLRRTRERVEAAPGIDVAIVVATEAGPRTTVLRDADRKGLAVLSEEIRSQVERARAGAEATPDESGSSLAITSFARFGIESAYPMLPQDQIFVLGVGSVLEQPVVRSGTLAVGSTLSLTLAFDPGSIGGAVAAQLLSAVRGRLEDPLGMML
jgi:pyruvate dehydrogenase E2 component (dihydrolipoamide acetyltransferase)